MSRNRRNKRSFSKVKEIMTSKVFINTSLILVCIIFICIGTIYYRNYEDKKQIAKEQEELSQQIKSIFQETSQSIENLNTTKKDVEISISAVGDILCGDEMLQDAYNEEEDTYTFDYMFNNIVSFLKKSDINIGTMETNFTTNKYSGYGNRNSPKEFAQAVKKSGVNLVSVSTNHSLDYGLDGLKTSKQYLQDLGYTTVGDNLGESRVVIKEIKNTKIAFLAYTYGVENQNSKNKEDLKNINIYEEKTVKEDLEYAKENADFNFVIMHWGDAYSLKPSKEQEKIADFLVENGANVILGSHPAVMQPMDIRQNKEGENVLIAYSLGNYISSIEKEESKVELILNIRLRKRGEDGKVVLSKVDYTPIYVMDNGKKANNRYELVDMKSLAQLYANGKTDAITKKDYEKLLQGLRLLKSVIEK